MERLQERPHWEDRQGSEQNGSTCQGFFLFFLLRRRFHVGFNFYLFHRRARKGRMKLSCLERLGACSMAGSPVLFEELQLVLLMDAIKACTTTRCQNNKKTFSKTFISSDPKIWDRWICHVVIRLIFVLV